MRKSANTAHKVAPWLASLLLIAVWEIAVRVKDMPPWYLPSPSRIVQVMGKDSALLFAHLQVTMLEALLGFVLAVAAGLIIAVILDLVPIVKKALYPILVTTQTIPIITIAPLIVIWLGYDLAPKIVVVVLVCFFPILISTLQGLGSVDPDLINLFRSMGASGWEISRRVKMPSALPALFSGMRISASYCVMAAVIGEWLGAKAGIGYYMLLAQKSFEADRVFAAIVLITLFSLLLLAAVVLMERSLLPWEFARRREDIS